MSESKNAILVNKETGEILTAKNKKTRGQNFVKMYIKNMIKMLEVTEGKRVKIIIYILKSIRLNDNTLICTQREIAKACNVSTKTVNETIKSLCAQGLLKKRSGAYMLSPDVLYRGDEQRKGYILNQFETFDKS